MNKNQNNNNNNSNNNYNYAGRSRANSRRNSQQPIFRRRGISAWRTNYKNGDNWNGNAMYRKPIVMPRNPKWQQNVIKVNKPKNVNNQMISRNNKNSIITGKDLVMPCDSNLITTSKIYAIIPISPLYWQGTRIKNLAAQYQYYKPESLSIEYVPTVSKFQKGTITIGCMSNPFVNDESIQNSLISSTSGESFSCSEQFVKKIALNSLLQQKKLLLGQTIDKENNPFFIIIYLSDIIDEKGFYIAPGTFYFNYKIHLFNPVANPLFYKTENSSLISEVDLRQQNIAGVLLTQNNKFTAGTIFTIEKTNNTFNVIINGSKANIDVNKKATYFYSSIPEMLEDKGDVINLNDWDLAATDKSINIPKGNYLFDLNTQEATLNIHFNENSSSYNVEVLQHNYYKLAQDLELINTHPIIILRITPLDPTLTIEAGIPESTTFINFKE
jgi:hypothetical protein